MTSYRNPVCEVSFLGFKSTTLELERAGWQVSAQQVAHTGTVRLALRHPVAHLYGLTAAVDYRSTMRTWDSLEIMRYSHLLGFHVTSMANEVRCLYLSEPGLLGSWGAVSCVPEATTLTSHNEARLEDLVPFRTVNPHAEQIIVAPESVTQVLDLLLACQAPAAQARRLRAERREVRQASEIQAQVVVEVA